MHTHTACAMVGLLALGTMAAAAPAITVNVNGAPIAFQGTPPMEVKGAVLVPLRGVFQALSASVKYDPAAKTITAQKGTTNVVLPVGGLTATVNGQPQVLSQPAQTVNGTTLVPLRFVAQALGAFVQWNAASSTVDIKTLDPHLASLPGLPAGNDAITGVLTGKYLNTNPPTFTVRVGGKNRSVPLVGGAYGSNTTSAVVGQMPHGVDLSDVSVGDQVTLVRDGSGNVTSITATHGEVRGTVKNLTKLSSGGTLLTLNDGKTVELVPNADVTMAGRALSLSDVQANEDVVVRTNPDNTLGYALQLAPNSVPAVPPTVAPPPAAPVNPPLAPTGLGETLPAGTSTVTITSFTQDAKHPLRAGDKVRVTLVGTPGGKASFSVPGLVESVGLKETTPGTYYGTFTAPKFTTLSGAAVLGKLSVGSVTAPIVQAAGNVTVDTQPPLISDLNPAKNATTESPRPLLYATLSDGGGSGVNAASLRITLDGTDITPGVTVTPAFFNVKPSADLAAGPHTISVFVADKAGNGQTTQWTFTAAPSNLIQSFTSDAAQGDALPAGRTVRFTLRAQPGGNAAASIGTTVSGIVLGESRTPGLYTGEYTVKPGDSVQNAPVVVRFVSPSGKVVTQTLAAPLSLSAGGLRKPVIVSPLDDVYVGDTVAIQGKASPNELVRVTISYVSKALGGLFSLNGTAATQDVRADKRGAWKTGDLSLTADNALFGKSQDTVFTVSAVSVGLDGTLSAPATIKVRR